MKIRGNTLQNSLKAITPLQTSKKELVIRENNFHSHPSASRAQMKTKQLSKKATRRTRNKSSAANDLALERPHCHPPQFRCLNKSKRSLNHPRLIHLSKTLASQNTNH